MASSVQKIAKEFARICEIRSRGRISTLYAYHYLSYIPTDFCLFEVGWRFSIAYGGRCCVLTVFEDAAKIREKILLTFPAADGGVASSFRDLPRDLRTDLARFADLLHANRIEFERKLAAVQARALAFPLVRDFLDEIYVSQIIAGDFDFPVLFEEVMTALRSRIADEIFELWDYVGSEGIDVFNLKIDRGVVRSKIFDDMLFRHSYPSKTMFAASYFMLNIDLNSPKLAIRVLRELRRERVRRLRA